MFVKPFSCPEIQLQIVMILPAILVIFVLVSQMSDWLKAGKAEIRKDWNLFQGWTLNSSIMFQLVKVQILTSNVFPPGLMWNYNIKEQDPVKKIFADETVSVRTVLSAYLKNSKIKK